MADLSQVEQAVANAITSIFYPDGSSQNSAVGVLCRVYRGWPNSVTLNSDLSSGILNVTIVSDNDSGRITTRYLSEWQISPSRAMTTISANNQTITLSGDPAVGDVIGALIDGRAYAYRIQPGDTPMLVAAKLNLLLPARYMASVAGPTITLPGAKSIHVRAVCDRSSSYESRRQEKDIRVIFWCSNPLIRDEAVSAVDAALNRMSFLSLSDGSKARIAYQNTSSYDQAQNALLYRRDLIYKIEYPTITTVQLPAMLFGASKINGNIIYA